MDQERFDIDFKGDQILSETRIDGLLKTEQSVCVDGVIRGTVQATGAVIVNRTGRIEGDVSCNELYLNGTVTGNDCVNHRTVMGKSAVIEGALMTSTLVITPGAATRNGLRLKNASN